jgi:hypothetical protein
MPAEEKGRLEKGAEKTGKVVGDGIKTGVGAIKSFGKGVGNRTDVTCDKCGKVMKPGGNIKKKTGGEDHQFCSEACAAAWKPGDKNK